MEKSIIMQTIIPLSRFRSLLAAAIALTLISVTPAQQAKEGRIPLGDDQTVSFSPATTAGGAAHLTLTLPRNLLPNPTPAEATLTLANTGDYTWWSGTLKAGAGSAWSVELPPEGVEAVLIADKAVISFSGGQPSFVLTRDRLVKQLGGVRPRMQGKPFFFSPPKPIELPAAITETATQAEAESYATNIGRWDSEMQTKLFGFDNELVRARSLWRDLSTAERLPWDKATITRLQALYEEVKSERAEFQQLRTEARNRAKAVLAAWNAAHADEAGHRPLELKFYSEV